MRDSLEKKFSEKSIKHTPQRSTIISVLSSTQDHLDAEAIYQRANKIDPQISLATIYRTLAIFEKNGIVNKLDFASDGKAKYEIDREEKGHHHHLIDVETGKIIEFSDSSLEKIKIDIAKKLGYELVDHRLELYGKRIKEESNQ